jgi:two-component system NtrC family sensor kinase
VADSLTPTDSELARLRTRVADLEREQHARLEAEAALRESESRYRELIDQCPDPIVVHRDGTLLFVNTAAAEMAGSAVKPADLVGRNALDFVHVDSHQFARDAVEAVAAGEPPLGQLELRVYNADGDERFVEVVDRIVQYEGKPALQVVVRDITARRHAEEALRAMRAGLEKRVAERTEELTQALLELRRNEASRRAMLRGSPDTLIRMRTDGTLLDVHAGPGFEEHFGDEPRKGRKLHEFSAPLVADRSLEVIREVCETGRMFRSEHAIERDGATYVFESRIVPIGPDEVLTVMRDITEAKRAQEELGDRERRFRKIFEDGPLGMALVAPDLKFSNVNAKLCEMFGYSAEELGELSFLDVAHPGDQARDLEILRDLADQHTSNFTIDKRFVRKDGTEIDVRVTGAMLRDPVDGHILYGIGMYEDITEQRRALAALRDTQERLHHSTRLASIGTLAAGIAHEINNPIGSILLAAQYALAAKDGSDETAKSLEDIADHARRCGRIVKNVLRFARQETLEREREDLNDCLDRVRGLVEHMAERHEAVVEYACTERPLPVLVSSTAVEQALFNVIRNALEAGQAGDRVEVRTEADTTHARVVVTDHGRGMTAEENTYLFDPFYTTRRAAGGTGLGLSISHGIITDHGGVIHVESQVGRGTSVAIVLPLADGPVDPRSQDGESPDRR